ncbi:MAG: arsinothricin resistance N-acetyltransferase ArsN1 family B [Pseudomonadota bacterium]
MKDATRFRIARPEDGADIAAIYAPIVEHTFISFEEIPPTADEMSERIATTLQTHPWLVAEDSVGVAAYAYATAHRQRGAYKWSCDASVYVAERARRQGLARLLYAALFETLINQGFASVFAGIALPNPASIALHEEMGFEPIGTYPRVGFKNGSWRDVGWWGRSLQTLDGDPRPPLRFGENLHSFVGAALG